MSYREPLDFLKSKDVQAGQWITVNGAHVMLQGTQFHPTHGWVNVSHGNVDETGRKAGILFGTKQSDGSNVSFKEGEATHHAITMGGKVNVYDSNQGTKVAEHNIGDAGKLPAPTTAPMAGRTTGRYSRPEVGRVGATGLVESPEARGIGASEPQIMSRPSGAGKYSTKPAGGKEDEPAPGTHEHYAGEYPGKGKRGSMASLHEHLRQNGFHVDRAEGEKNQYGSPTDKVGNAVVYTNDKGQEARMVIITPADHTWVNEPSQYNPETMMTSTRSSMRRPVTEWELQ